MVLAMKKPICWKMWKTERRKLGQFLYRPQNDEKTYYSRIVKYIRLVLPFFEDLLVAPDNLISMYLDEQTGINRLKRNIGNLMPEEINESPHSAPLKRIIQFLPNYESPKAQVRLMVPADIGLTMLRKHCPYFNKWITKL